MGSFRKFITIIAITLPAFGLSPLTQSGGLSASVFANDSDLCGMSNCCCCSNESTGSISDDNATRECKCRVSESDIPPDIELVAVERQSDRDKPLSLAISVSVRSTPTVNLSGDNS